MDAVEVLAEAFGRVPGLVRQVVDGLDEEALAWRPSTGANSISWLVWHLARQQDAQVSAMAGQDRQVWTDRGWAGLARLPFPARETGYGMSAADVAQVRLRADLLLGYVEDVHAATSGYLRTLAADDLDQVVDESWDPPVTRGVRLVSVVDDALQHAGQAAYLRGLLERGAGRGGS